MPRAVLSYVVSTVLLLAGLVAGAGETEADPPKAFSCFTLWEIRLPSPPEVAAALNDGVNPHDASAIRIDLFVTPPDGKTVRVPMFYGQPHVRAADDPRPERPAFDDQWRIRPLERADPDFLPAGPPVWTGRFTPEEPGSYRYVVRVLAAPGFPDPREVARGMFVAGREDEHPNAANPAYNLQRPFVPEPAPRRDDEDAPLWRFSPREVGFIRRHPTVPDRFAVAGSEGWFALGENVCWVGPKQGVGQYEAYFNALAAAGANCVRVWLCTWDLDLDGRQPLAFDPVVAARLDGVFEAARRLGIRVIFCLDNFHDFRHNWEKSPFNAVNGGPCPTRMDFWTDPAAKEQYRSRLRYLVGRYSAYVSLMAWELWNEADYTLTPADLLPGTGPSDPTAPRDAWIRKEVIVPWTAEMSDALKDMDPHRHLVTTSLGMHANWPELWNLPGIDLVQFHSYVHRYDELRSDMEDDEARLVAAAARSMRRYGKPALLSEFGYMGQGSTSEMNTRDPDGLLLHNALWSGTMAGLAGTPMPWWWDNYIDPQGLYRHFAPLALFLKDMDWGVALEPVRVESETLRLMGLRASGAGMSVVWLQNREHTWSRRLLDGIEPRRLEAVEAFFPVERAGTWNVTWIDPVDGRTLASEAVETTTMADTDAPAIPLRPPPFDRSVAARLTPE